MKSPINAFLLSELNDSSRSGLENTASDRMLAHRAYQVSSDARSATAVLRSIDALQPASVLEFDGPKLNPVPAPPAVDLPSCLTWSFLAAPPPETLDGLTMYAHQMALAVLDVHERLLALEIKSSCGWRTFFGLRRSSR